MSYQPTEAQQLEASEAGITGQFIVEYDVDRDLDAGEIQVLCHWCKLQESNDSFIGVKLRF